MNLKDWPVFKGKKPDVNYPRKFVDVFTSGEVPSSYLYKLKREVIAPNVFLTLLLEKLGWKNIAKIVSVKGDFEDKFYSVGPEEVPQADDRDDLFIQQYILAEIFEDHDHDLRDMHNIFMSHGSTDKFYFYDFGKFGNFFSPLKEDPFSEGYKPNISQVLRYRDIGEKALVQLERLKAQFESEKFKDELKEISKYLDDSFGISFSDVFRGQGKKTEEEFIKILLERVEKSIEEVRQSI
jgi:hypothetical protein